MYRLPRHDLCEVHAQSAELLGNLPDKDGLGAVFLAVGWELISSREAPVWPRSLPVAVEASFPALKDTARPLTAAALGFVSCSCDS